MGVLSFAEALKEMARGPRNLLIGNGFSIAQGGTRFNYPTLLARSDLRDRKILNVFRKLKTSDFEEVMRALEHAAAIEAAYGEAERSDMFQKDAAAVRDALIDGVRKVHPGVIFDIPEEQLTACAAFLKEFHLIFTLNYDLLLYWVIIKCLKGQHRDGFGYGKPIEGFRQFDASSKPTVFFVHGALHLFLSGQNETQKRVVTSGTIINDITDTIHRARKLPLFVAEGNDDQKKRKINSVPYLRYAYDRLGKSAGYLLIFGHSAGENDAHIYDAIANSKITTIYYCVFQLQELSEVQERLARRLGSNSRKVKYVDSGTVGVWGT
jgi:hypothetical protein